MGAEETPILKNEATRYKIVPALPFNSVCCKAGRECLELPHLSSIPAVGLGKTAQAQNTFILVARKECDV